MLSCDSKNKPEFYYALSFAVTPEHEAEISYENAVDSEMERAAIKIVFLRFRTRSFIPK